MPNLLTPHFIDLVSEAALKSFWRRKALAAFLRRSGIKESFLASWSNEETKRDLLSRLFLRLERSDVGLRTIRKMATFLAEQTTFPDLVGWEDSNHKQSEARRAVEELRLYLRNVEAGEEEERERAEARKRAQQIRDENLSRRESLETLGLHLNELASSLGTQSGGYEFEKWFFDLVDFFDIVCRRPYINNGRQVDGSVTIDGTTYLVELKFTSNPSDGPDIDVFFKRVHDVADNTMGILVSISGFTGPAKTGASGPRTPLLLLDHGHLYLVLTGMMTFSELVSRLRRHASQTGQAYLPASEV